MYYDDEYWLYEEEEEREPDAREQLARRDILQFFEERTSEVAYSRQLEVRFQGTYFHWITNRALRGLVSDGELVMEKHPFLSGYLGVVRHPRCRYYTRQTNNLVSLVTEFSDPLVTAGIGDQGEMLVLEGFARRGFVMYGRDVNEYRGTRWERTRHDLDFIFERDGHAYGVEVKNILPYMNDKEFKVKLEMCQHLNVVPIFACRMLPATWIQEVHEVGGFCLIMKYQMYPRSLRPLVDRMRDMLEYPVDTPRRLEDGTMNRLERFIERRFPM